MGDDDFKKYMGDDLNDGDKMPGGPQGQQNNLPFFVIFALREKIKSAVELYSSTLATYNNMPDSAEKKALWEFIKTLMKTAEDTLDQFDFIIMEQEPYEDEDGEHGEGPDV